jgi:ubiquinone/menaquinone biosynthesis C-methylase UbiE
MIESIHSNLLIFNMKLKKLHPVFFILILTVLHSLWAIAAPNSNATSHYEFYPPSIDATGKMFMGREIAHVMGFQGAAWLERQNRVQEERTDILVKALNLTVGMQIADIGAGTGFLSREMAKLVGEQGRVYAVEIQLEMFGKIKKLQKTYRNIIPILASDQHTNLAPNSADLAIMVDVYHELAYPFEVIQDTMQALKQNGRIVLVEYRGEDDNVPIKPSHKMTETQIIKEMRVHGLQHEKTIKSLPWQHIVIFRKP